MAKDIYQKAEQFREDLLSDPRVISLQNIEKEMSENEEVMRLSYLKDVTASNYSDILNYYSEDSKEAKEALKKLHQAKLELDNHPLVRKYLGAYKEVRKLYEEINAVLFSDFAANLCPKEK